MASVTAVRAPQPRDAAGASFSDDQSRRRAKARYLRSLREGADRAALGLPTHRRSRGLTQAELAEGINTVLRGTTDHHIGERRLRQLEALGDPWPQHVADAYAAYLRLVEPELSGFYTTIGRAPAGSTLTHLGEVTAADRFYLDRTLAGTPAYLSDPLWDLRYRNRAFADLVPDLVLGSNILEFVLCSRRGREVFPRWEEWAVPMLDQLYTAWRGAEGELKIGLQRVVDVCLANRDVARLWKGSHEVDLSPNGDVRTLRPGDPDSLSGLGPATPVCLFVTVPINRVPGWRYMFVTPLTGEECEEPIDVDTDHEFWFRHAPQSAPARRRN